MTTVQEELTYLNLVADLESEAETPCESKHLYSTCSQRVAWWYKSPCSCPALLVCHNLKRSWDVDIMLYKRFRCSRCNAKPLKADDYIWRAV